MPLDTYRKPKRQAAPTGYNWDALLKGYPGYAQSIADIDAQRTAQGLSFDEARQRALVGYGSLGEFGGRLGALRPGTAELAAQNPYSTSALLNRDFGKAQNALAGNLAGRGLLRSGAYLQHSNDNLFNQGQARFTAQQGLLDTLGKLQSGYTQDQQGLARDAATATAQATAGVVKGIGAGLYPAAPTTATAPRTPAPQTPKLPAAPTRSPLRISPTRVRYGAI